MGTRRIAAFERIVIFRKCRHTGAYINRVSKFSTMQLSCNLGKHINFLYDLPMTHFRQLKLLAFFLAGIVLSTEAASGDKSLPDEVWWYWDRPAVQLPLPAKGVGAAVVTTHIFFSGDHFSRQSRRSALRLPDEVAIVPVIHVEVDPAHRFAGNTVQRDALRDAVVDVARRGGSIGWVQLDFEARQSQREFWRAGVESIKAALPTGVRLSVTALASWCYGDRWLSDIPVDEVVPMYFRLGRSRPDYVLRSAEGTTEPRCALAHGVADDESPWPVALSGRRYVFLGHRTRRPTNNPNN